MATKAQLTARKKFIEMVKAKKNKKSSMKNKNQSKKISMNNEINVTKKTKKK